MMRRLALILLVAIGIVVSASSASADASLSDVQFASGVLVRHDGGYMILGTARASESGAVIATIRGQLVERTVGFNTCPDVFFGCQGFGLPTCNLLGGAFTVRFTGELLEFDVGFLPDLFRLSSHLCQPPRPFSPDSFGLGVYGNVCSFDGGPLCKSFMIFAPARQISPTVFAWSGSAIFLSRTSARSRSLSAAEIHLGEGTGRNIASHRARLDDIFGDRDPATLTVAQQIEAVGKLAQDLAASTLTHYWATHRQILDFTGVRPNPARDPSVKLPKVRTEEVSPPSAGHFLAMLGWITDTDIIRAVVTMEQTGMAIGETLALEWGDVDIAGCEFRLRRAAVKGGIRSRARRVQVPEWLMSLIVDSCPLEDRTATRRVFQVTARRIRAAMEAACNTAGIPVYTPHDLRHRRLSLWHGQGVPARELAARAGHSRASMTLDVYSHVMPLDEASMESLEAVLVRSR
jgi:integrase